MGKLSLLKKRPLNVLIVEDDEELRDILQAEFELEGLTVLTASNGSEAVTSVRRIKPDLILMDVLMPVMNGIEATRSIKDDEDNLDIPIIMLTVIDNKNDIIKGLKAGAIDYINKPFFMPEIKARVKAILQHKIMYDELKRIQDTLLRNERSRTIKELTEAVQGSLNGPLTVILGRLDLLRRKQGYICEDDLQTLENAANRIREIVSQLGIMECFYPSPLLNDIEIDDLAFIS